MVRVTDRTTRTGRHARHLLWGGNKLQEGLLSKTMLSMEQEGENPILPTHSGNEWHVVGKKRLVSSLGLGREGEPNPLVCPLEGCNGYLQGFCSVVGTYGSRGGRLSAAPSSSVHLPEGARPLLSLCGHHVFFKCGLDGCPMKKQLCTRSLVDHLFPVLFKFCLGRCVMDG